MGFAFKWDLGEIDLHCIWNIGEEIGRRPLIFWSSLFSQGFIEEDIVELIALRVGLMDFFAPICLIVEWDWLSLNFYLLQSSNFLSICLMSGKLWLSLNSLKLTQSPKPLWWHMSGVYHLRSCLELYRSSLLMLWGWVLDWGWLGIFLQVYLIGGDNIGWHIWDIDI